jgi:hypothetical protein
MGASQGENMERRTSVYVGQHGVDPDRRLVLRRKERMHAGKEESQGGGKLASRDRRGRDVMWKKRMHPTFNHLVFSTFPPRTRHDTTHRDQLQLLFPASSFLPFCSIDSPRSGAIFLHHGRRRGRLGLHLQDGDGRRVGFRVVIYQDEDPAFG